MVKRRLVLCMVFFLVLVAGFGCGTPSPALDAQRLLSAFVSYTDLRISSVQRSVRILASTSEAKSGDWEKMKDLLAGYQETEEGLIVWYVHPDGTYYTVDKGLMDVTLSDRSYFPDLMASKVVTGEVVVSKSTAQRSAIIAAPVKNGDVVVGAVGASLFLDKLSEEINTMLALGPDASFFALAPNALTALHRHTDRHFLDPRDLGSESLKAAVERMLSDTSGEVTYEFDNRMKRATYHTSPLTQWRFAIAM